MATRSSTRNKIKEEVEEVEAEIKEEIVTKEENVSLIMEDEEKKEIDDDEDDGNGGDDIDNQEEDNEKEKTENTEQEKKAVIANKNLAKLETDSMNIDELLLLKVMLSDGTEQFLFSRGPKYSDERWPINCHLCRLGNLFTEDNLKLHLKGRGHLFKLSRRAPLAKYYSEPFYQSMPKDMDKEKPIKIYPGEIIKDITEEFQDRIISKDEFQVKLPEDKMLIKQLEKEHLHEYNTKLPLLGLCYIYKMMGFQGVTYFCTLCNTKIKEESFKHIVGSEHQFKYINRHFPKLYEKVFEELKPIRGIDVRFCVRNVFRKLYRKIENIKGNRKVTICDDKDFFKNRKKFLLKTRFDEHYDEDTIMITEQEVDVLIRKCINGMQFIKPDLISLGNPSLGLRTCYQDERNGSQIGNNMGYNSGGNGGGYNDFNDSSSDWNNYYQVINGEIEDLNREYRNYDRFPRKHPKYEGEFNKYNSFKKDGADKDKKEFNMPWNTYWKRRLRVLYENDLLKRKQRIKKAFGLRINMRTPSPPRGGGCGGWNNQGPVNNPMMMLGNNNYGGGNDGGYNQGFGGNYGRGYNNNFNDYYGNNQQSAVAGLRDVMMAMMQSTVQQVQSSGGGNNMRNVGNNIRGGDGGSSGFSGRGNNISIPLVQTSSPELPSASNEPLGVISVLRLFNALESQLGSLGPQAVQLLSRAVLVEKNNQNPNDLMMEKDFYIFFATAREKLKGQYFANMIGSNLISAVKKTIQDATILMEMFEDYCKRTGKNLPNIEIFSDLSSRGGMSGNGGNNKGNLNRDGNASGSGNDNWKSNTNNYGGSNQSNNDDFKHDIGFYKNNNNKNSGNDYSQIGGNNDKSNKPFANDDFFLDDNKIGTTGYLNNSGNIGGFSNNSASGYSGGGGNNSINTSGRYSGIPGTTFLTSQSSNFSSNPGNSFSAGQGGNFSGNTRSNYLSNHGGFSGNSSNGNNSGGFTGGFNRNQNMTNRNRNNAY